jgi:hypothetical protein
MGGASSANREEGEDNIKTDLRKTGFAGINCINLP